MGGIWAVLAARQPPARSVHSAALRSRVGGVTARLMAPPLLPSPPIRGVTEAEGSQTMTQETKASTFAPKFQLGQIVATPGAIAACSPQHLTRCLHRHSRGDRGNVCAEEKAQNDQALVEGERVPWRTATKNWEQAEQELANSSAYAPLVSIWRWCGFAEKSEKKGLYAWISLSLPALMFGGGLLFNHWTGERQREISSEERKDVVLREYTKGMKIILLDPKTSLGIMKPCSEAHSVARALTLTTLTQLQGQGPLSPQRRSLAFQILREAQAPILAGAYLVGYDLIGANLSGVRWDNQTRWPYKAAFQGAMSIPPALMKLLGLDLTLELSFRFLRCTASLLKGGHTDLDAVSRCQQ